MLGSVLQTALTGLQAAELQIRTTANNLANANTDGFKASSPVYSAQAAGPDGVGRGVQTDAIQTDFSQGSIVIDDNPLSLALQGDGFFAVESGGERLFARNGQFQLNADGEVRTATGERLLILDDADSSGATLQPLRVGRSVGGSPLERLQIGRDGAITARYSDGQTRDLGRIAVARFANPNGLVAGPNGLRVEGPNSGSPLFRNSQEGVSVLSGARERSNVDVASELLQFNSATLAYRANLQTMRVADELFESLLNLRRS